MLESVEAHLPKSLNSYFKKKLHIKQTNKKILKEINVLQMHCLTKVFIDWSNNDVFLIYDNYRCWNPSKPQKWLDDPCGI